MIAQAIASLQESGAAGSEPIHSFDVEEVARLVGVSVQRLRYWDRTGLVRPGMMTPGAVSARYSFADIVTLRTVRKMLDAGISLRKIRRVIGALQQLRPELERPLAGLALITDGESVFVPTDDPDVMLSVLPPGQLAWKLPLGKIAAEVARTLEQEAA
jgi:DNA-binding transcriptional MerR regulator